MHFYAIKTINMKKLLTITLLLQFICMIQAVGQVGKRQHKPVVALDSSKVKVKQGVINSPRDAQSGQATGKRMHKPIQQQVNNEKLDDLKNPFDTTKLKTQAPTVEEQTPGQNRKRNRNGNAGNTSGSGANQSNRLDVMSTPNENVQKQKSNETQKLNPEFVTITRSYKSKNGNVELRFEKNKQTKNNVRTTTRELRNPMCLSKEEVRGQKIENEISIVDGSKATQILPGGVIDATILLNTGEFTFINMDKRKPITIISSSNQSNSVRETATSGPNNNITDELRAAVHRLTNKRNISGMPNMSSSSEAKMSTLEETIGLHMGSSFFYMGMKGKSNFNFSASKYRFMYTYTFQQECFAVSANQITSPDNVFTESFPLNNNWLYVQQVKYGRRLYVLMESEYDLEKYSAQLKGDVNWGAVSAKFNNKVQGDNFAKEVNIRVYTQGGQPLVITDETKIQQQIDDYFKAPFKEIDIVPLSYKLTYLDGAIASLTSTAFLDGDNCLDQDKVRIRIKSIECKKVDDNKNSEELYGSAVFKMYNTNGQVLLSNATPAPPTIPSGRISFGSKDAPINLLEGRSKTYRIDEQDKYVDMSFSNLDFQFEILPFLHEKDNGLNADDTYITENRMKRTLRQMLIEGTTSQAFEFRRKGSIIIVHFEVTPI
jgi:hypothetical protein